MAKNMIKIALIFSGLIIQYVQAEDYVPVLMWESGSSDPIKAIPALEKMSSESFKSILQEKSAHKDLVLLFAEENISAEDFSWSDEMGITSFTQLMNVTQEAPYSQFLSAVESPVEAVMSLEQAWEHVTPSPELPSMLAERKDSAFVFVHLEDATDSENRPEMLSRHDSLIAKTFNAARQNYRNVLAVYSGFHSSWVPGDETVRRVRHLLAADEPSFDNNSFINADDKVYLYSSSSPVFSLNNASTLLNTVIDSYVEEIEEGPLKLTVVYDVDENNYTMVLYFPESTPGYWSLSDIELDTGTETYTLSAKGIYAPYRFSYHCSLGTTFENKANKTTLSFTDFQVEPLPPRVGRFSDAYDCVWFFTVPIWSGILTTLLLVSILSSGLCMILDIKTMDRFDDPKGKTITINTNEPVRGTPFYRTLKHEVYTFRAMGRNPAQ